MVWAGTSFHGLVSLLGQFNLGENGLSNSMFDWMWLIVNDRKFSAGIIFFSYTNQPAVLVHESATM